MTDALGEPAVHVEHVGGAGLGAVWVHVELRFGIERAAWDVGPLYVEGSTLDAPLLVPEAAYLHPEQARFVTPVVVTVSSARGREQVDLVLAWPDGLDAEPELWDGPTADLRAPQGVLDSTLRVEPSEHPERVVVDHVVPAAVSGPARPRGGTEVDR